MSLQYKISRKSVEWDQRPTDGRTDVTKLIGAFTEYAKAPKKWNNCVNCWRSSDFQTQSLYILAFKQCSFSSHCALCAECEHSGTLSYCRVVFGRFQVRILARKPAALTAASMFVIRLWSIGRNRTSQTLVNTIKTSTMTLPRLMILTFLL